MLTRQEEAAWVSSAGVSSTRASFSASAKVLGETSGPTAGPVPKAEGAPGGSCEGFCVSASRETAAPRRPRDICARNCLRGFGMSPPNAVALAPPWLAALWQESLGQHKRSIVSESRRPRRVREKSCRSEKGQLGRLCALSGGGRDLLFVVHGEEQVVLETVAAMRAAASPIVKDLRYLRQPHIEIARLQMHWAISDGGMVSGEADVRQGGDEIRFQPHDLKAIRGDPGAPLEGD